MNQSQGAPSKQERTYRLLRERILDGTYGPGYRLVIDALARELDVSPMPVREAIRRLQAEGWVLYRANQGAQVAPVDARSWREVMVTLALLEGYATAEAAPYISGGDLENLRQLNRRVEGAIEELDLMQVARFNQAFHELIYGRCPNAHLRGELQTTTELLNTLRSTVFVFIPSRGHASAAEHEELLQMIEAGADAAELEQIARRHKLRTVEAYEARLADNDLVAFPSAAGGTAGVRR